MATGTSPSPAPHLPQPEPVPFNAHILETRTRSCRLAASKPRRRPSLRSARFMTWRRGVLSKGHLPRPQIRMMQESVHEMGRSADAAPVVVP